MRSPGNGPTSSASFPGPAAFRLTPTSGCRSGRILERSWREFYGRVQQEQRELTARIAALPGVRQVAWGWDFPGADRRQRAFAINAIVAFSLAQRRRELAVRLALGAGARGVVVRPAAMMALIMIAGLTACLGPLRKALALRPLDWLKE